MKKPSPRLNRARAYYRLAAKFDRAGSREGARYRMLADRLVDEDRRHREHVKRWQQRAAQRRRATD